MDISPYFENDETCDGYNCPGKETCARWVGNVAITYVKDGVEHLCGFPIHNTRKWPCRFWLAIPNERYPGKNDVRTI